MSETLIVAILFGLVAVLIGGAILWDIIGTWKDGGGGGGL